MQDLKLIILLAKNANLLYYVSLYGNEEEFDQ